MQITEEEIDLEADLTQGVANFKLMSSVNIRDKIMAQMEEKVQGVSGRWTFFS